MATQEVKSSQLRLVLIIGSDDDGNPIFRNKIFNNVKPIATADNLFAIATAFTTLQEHSLYEVVRNDSSSLAEE